MSTYRVPLLANEYVTVLQSPDPARVYCYSPGLARLPSGRLVATMDLGGPGAAELTGPKAARSYASMVIDGDDLHVLSRSGDRRAKNAHDGNLITFHTVRGFRGLVY